MQDNNKKVVTYINNSLSMFYNTLMWFIRIYKFNSKILKIYVFYDKFKENIGEDYE